jgi:hypothetical protein
VCREFTPARWIRVLREDAENPGDLKEVWVDRESVLGPRHDSVWTEMGDLGVSAEVFRSRTRWHDFSPDSGYALVEADVACDREALRYLENARYSKEGALLRRADAEDIWFSMLKFSFEAQVFEVVCDMGSFFQPEPTPGTSPEAG